MHFERFTFWKLRLNNRSEKIRNRAFRKQLFALLMNRIKYALLMAIVLFANAAAGAELQLEVAGKIKNFTDQKNKSYRFSEKDLLLMDKHSIRTSTNWTKTETFSGFLVSDLLKRVGATGSALEVYGLDGYTYTIPISDVARYRLIFAYERQGKRMSVKELGPLGLIYPRNQYPVELNGPVTDAKFVWQVSKIIVR